jgi:hypothetical protein
MGGGPLGSDEHAAAPRDGMDTRTLGIRRLGSRPLGAGAWGTFRRRVGPRPLAGWYLDSRPLDRCPLGGSGMGPRALAGGGLDSRPLGGTGLCEFVGARALGTPRQLGPRPLAVREAPGEKR